MTSTPQDETPQNETPQDETPTADERDTSSAGAELGLGGEATTFEPEEDPEAAG